MGCIKNSDCGPNQLCYNGTSWIEEFSENGCYCSTFYGWEGPGCETKTLMTAFVILLGCINFFLGFAATSSLCLFSFRLHRRGKLMRLTPFTATIGLTIVASLSGALWGLSIAINAIDPGKAKTPENFTDKYGGKFNIWSIIVSVLGIVTGGIALIHVSLVWVEIAINTGRLNGRQVSKLINTKKWIYLFEVMAVIAGIIGAVVEKKMETFVFGVLMTPFIVFILASYIYGALRLNSILKEVTGASGRSRASTGAISAASDKASSDSKKQPTTDVTNTGEAIGVVVPGSPDLEKNSKDEENDGGDGETDEDDNKPARKKSFFTLGRTLQRNKAKMKRSMFSMVMTRVRNTTIAISVCMFGFWLGNFAISIMDLTSGWKEFAPPNSFNWVVLSFMLVVTSLNVAAVTITLYLQSTKKMNHD